MNGKLFIKNGVLLTCISFVAQIVGMYFGIYFSNILGAEGIGLFQLIMSVYMLGMTVGIGGISIAMTRIISKELETGNKTSAINALYAGIFFSLCTAVLTTFSLRMLSEIIVANWIYDTRALVPLQVLSLTFPFTAISTCINAYFISARKIKTYSTLMIIEQSFRVICTLLAISFSPSNIESYLIYICSASLIAEAFAATVKLCTIICVNNHKEKCKKKKYLKDICKISLPIGLSSCIRSFLNMLQNILIPVGLRKFGNAAEDAMSAYGVIRGMAIPIVIFPAMVLSSFISLLIPEISRFYERQNRNAISRAIMKSTGLTLIFSIALTGVFICYGSDIGYITYTDKSVGGYIVLLAPLVTFMFLDDVVDCILKGLNQQMKSLEYNIIESLVRVLMLYFLVPIYGIPAYIAVIFTGNLLNFALSFNRLTQVADVYIDYKNWIIKPVIAISIALIFTKSFVMRGIILYSYTITIIWAVASTLIIFTLIIILWDCLTFNHKSATSFTSSLN